MKTYEAVFNEDSDGVFGISLVNNPAMESQFIALSKQEIHFAEVDKEQKILMGLVLEPNKPIYRSQNGEEFNIVFNEQTIKDLSFNFFKQNNQHNSTIEHTDKIEGVTFVESWIIEDPLKDKSAVYGFSHPKGTWMATMKVHDDNIWNEYVKTGKVLGFSIDAVLQLKEVNLKKQVKMAEYGLKDLKNDIMTMFNKDKVKEVEVKAEEVKPKEEKPEVEAKEIEEAKVYVEEAIFDELKEKVTEVLAEFSKFKEEAVKKDEKIVELEKQVVEFGKQPAAKPIQAQPTVELNKKGRLLQLIRNN